MIPQKAPQSQTRSGGFFIICFNILLKYKKYLLLIKSIRLQLKICLEYFVAMRADQKGTFLSLEKLCSDSWVQFGQEHLTRNYGVILSLYVLT